MVPFGPGNRRWLVLSGALSPGLGIPIFANFAAAALTTLGLAPAARRLERV